MEGICKRYMLCLFWKPGCDSKKNKLSTGVEQAKSLQQSRIGSNKVYKSMNNINFILK